MKISIPKSIIVKQQIEYILAFILFFMLVYNISPLYNPSINTARLALLVGGAYVLIFKNQDISYFANKCSWLLWLFIPFIYAVILYFFIGDYGILARFINLFLYAICGSIILATIIKKLDVLIFIVFFATVLQSILIILIFFNLEFKIFIAENIFISSNYSVFRKNRALGFAGVSGAALSLIQSFGILSYYMYKKKYNSNNILIHILFQIGVTLIIFSTILVGRTGLILSFIFLTLIIIDIRKNPSSLYFSLIIIVASLFFLIGVAIGYMKSLDVPVESIFNWAFGVFIGQDSTNTVEVLRSQPLPPLNIALFHGYGLVSSLSIGGNPSGHDAGFIQFLYAYGLPNTIIFYFIYVMVLYKIFNYYNFNIRIFLMGLIFLLEVKEPFLFKYSMFIMLVMFYLCASYEKYSLKTNEE